jgi:hypothetical protein
MEAEENVIVNFDIVSYLRVAALCTFSVSVCTVLCMRFQDVVGRVATS